MNREDPWDVMLCLVPRRSDSGSTAVRSSKLAWTEKLEKCTTEQKLGMFVTVKKWWREGPYVIPASHAEGRLARLRKIVRGFVEHKSTGKE